MTDKERLIHPSQDNTGGSAATSNVVDQVDSHQSSWHLLWQRRRDQMRAIHGEVVAEAPLESSAGGRATKEDVEQTERQMSFLAPDDAQMLHMLRRFVSEASRIYERRTGRDMQEAICISSPKDAYEYLRFEMEDLEQEQIRTINLDVKNRIISSQMIHHGTVGSAFVRIAEVFRPAIIDNASAIIVAHNHPSGSLDPSNEDVRLTNTLIDAGKLLDVEVLDHLVISNRGFVSFKERGWGFD